MRVLLLLTCLALFTAGCSGPPADAGAMPSTGGSAADTGATSASTVDMDLMMAMHKAAWLCQDDEVAVEDRDNPGAGLTCSVDLSFEDGYAVVRANGIPNHDFDSTFGCCATDQDYVWKFPLQPQMAGSNQEAPLRGAIATAVNGAAIYGPEDGPGGDAVASDAGEYNEDRQQIALGVCHGHTGPGGQYHYHADANCLHWHGDIDDYDWGDLQPTEHSPIIGFAFDGFPIYGFFGWDDAHSVIEMTSSYRLKDGATGYDGIAAYEYVDGLGTLDDCNGRFFATPEFPDGIYHYHTTRVNGQGDIGFPYFLNCYKGVPETSNEQYLPEVGGQGGNGQQPPPGGDGGGKSPPPPR